MTHISATPSSLHGATSEIDHGVLGDDVAGVARFATMDEASAFAWMAIREAREQGWIGDISIAISDGNAARDMAVRG